MKRVEHGNGFEIVAVKDFILERQVELEVVLEPGEYVVLPRTTGCNLRKPDSSSRSDTTLPPSLLDSTGTDLDPIAELIIKDIFRRLDKLTIDNSLSYNEFKEFYKRLSLQPMSEETFNRDLLKSYKEMNKRGFLNFWKDVIKKGEDTDV